METDRVYSMRYVHTPKSNFIFNSHENIINLANADGNIPMIQKQNVYYIQHEINE